MATLIIVPDDNLRHRLRDHLVAAGTLRARTYEHGLVLAEQNTVGEAVVWSPKGADASAVSAVVRLRKFNRETRIVVVTPEFTKGGVGAFVDALQVDAYLLETAFAAIIEAVTGIPTIVERSQRPTVSGVGGSSAARH